MSDTSVIHKTPLLMGLNIYPLPKGAEIVSVHEQASRIMMWYLFREGEQETRPRTILVVGTGHPFPTKACRIIGTVHERGFVWHVLEMFG